MPRKRTKIEREADLATIGSLHLQGLSQREIAQAIGLSQPQVGHEVREIQKRWAKKDFAELQTIRNQELMKLNELERVGWAAWRDSCRDKETRSQEKVTSTQPESDEENVAATERLKANLRAEQRDGNPDFLKLILTCMDRRSKILGLYDPKQMERAKTRPIEIVEVVSTVLVPADQHTQMDAAHETETPSLLRIEVAGPDTQPNREPPSEKTPGVLPGKNLPKTGQAPADGALASSPSARPRRPEPW